MLKEGTYYRNPAGGVLLVEKVGASFANVKITTGKRSERHFVTGGGDKVDFESVESRHTTISPLSVLEPATDEEVSVFVRRPPDRAGPDKPAETMEAVPKDEKRPRRTAIGHQVVLTPEARNRKKAAASCPYGGCDEPASYRLYWVYADGKTFCRACNRHARRFAELHGVDMPSKAR